MASYSWYAQHAVLASENRGRKPGSGTPLRFPPNFAFLYNALTLPEHRGRALMANIHDFAARRFAEEGVTHFLTTTDWTNTPALRAMQGGGFRSIGIMWRFGFGSSVACVYPRAARRLGVVIG